LDAEKPLVDEGPIRKILILTVLLFIALFFGFRILSKPTPEQALRNLIQEAEKAIEQKNLPKSLSYISRDYHDEMDFDYDTLAYLAHQAFRAYPEIQVTTHIQDVSVGEKRGVVFLEGEILGRIPPGPSDDLLAYWETDQFVIIFKEEKDGWKALTTQKQNPE